MEEFIEKFNEFRDWLYDQEINSPGTSIVQIVKKFEELELDEAF